MSNDLQGKTAMVTGSSSGIGRAIAVQLAQQGANVIVHGRADSQHIESVCTEIESHNVDCFKIFADFTKIKSWEQFVENAWSWKNNIDFWINNAGGDVLTGDWPERDLESKLDFLFKVDVAATLMLSKKIGDRMKDVAGEAKDTAPGGRAIINIGWDQAWQGMAGTSGELFATTKGAIMSMTKSLAQSYAPQVRVNCIAPGWIQTHWGEQASDYWDDRARNESLMGRWGTPEDVAGVAAFLCSDAASFVSGQIIPVNGGYKFDRDRPSN